MSQGRNVTVMFAKGKEAVRLAESGQDVGGRR